jgi:hypothetical protein
MPRIIIILPLWTPLRVNPGTLVSCGQREGSLRNDEPRHFGREAPGLRKSRGGEKEESIQSYHMGESLSSFSAFPCAIFSLSAGLIGAFSRNVLA